MSLREEICAVLRNGSGPMTAGEIREVLGADEYTAAEVGGMVSYMSKQGELLRDLAEGSSTRFVYQLDPSFDATKKRASPDAAAVPPPTAVTATSRAKRDPKPKAIKTAKKPKAAKAVKAKRRYTKRATSTAIVADTRRAAGAIARAANGHASSVPIERDSLRTLAFALVALHPDPMPDKLKAAVVVAIEATL